MVKKSISILKERVISRRILKKQKQPVVKIPDYKAESIWEDTNRFFKNEMEETKKSLFFS